MARELFTSRRSTLSRKHIIKNLKRYFVFGLVGTTGLLIASFLILFFVLPSPSGLAASLSGSTQILDKDGKLIHSLYSDRQSIYVKSNDIHPLLKKATVAIEDKDFYSHRGFDPLTIVRIPFNYIFRGRRVVGGSTLTQQLVKQTYLDSSRTVTRKVKELVLAIKIEGKLSKDEILTEYLNVSSYGGTYEGVGAASKGYFDKKPSELSILECAILAGLPQAPSVYSPFVGTPNAWKPRTREVLRRMLEDKYIKKSEYDEAISEIATFEFANEKVSITAPHFVFYVKKLAEAEVGSAALKNGATIKTTLDLDLQLKSEKIVYDEVTDLKKHKVGNGAAVALDTNTGEIRAMVGSYDFNDDKYGKFNVVADETALRQPGSTLKPLLTAFAIEDKKITASTAIMDVKTVFPVVNQDDYVPGNYDGKFRGPVQIRYAVANSYNIPMVKLMAMYGLENFLTKLSSIGLKSLAPTKKNMQNLGLSVSLGGGDTTMLELASGYNVLARGGSKVSTSAILEIRDGQGKILYKRDEPVVRKVLDPAAAFIVSHILSDNASRSDAFGPNSYLKIAGRTVAVKTGTTNDKRDNWTAGYTQGITIVTWVGNNDNSPMSNAIVSGTTGASPIWNKIMTTALKKYQDGIPKQPDTVIAVDIDSVLGGKIKDDSKKRSEFFIKDTEPKETASGYIKIKMSREQKEKKANDAEIAAGQYEDREFIEIKEKDLVSLDGKNRWQEAIDTWAKEQPNDSPYHVPTEFSDRKIEPTKPPEPTRAPEAPTATQTPPSPTATPEPSLTPTPTV